MIQRADADYLARLFVKAPGGFWHLHTRGIEPFIPEGVALDVTTSAVVRQGRWVALCPLCAGAQLAVPEMDRLLCVDCANVKVGGQWVRVVWPDEEGVVAIEAALVARPEVHTRNWEAHETVGSLLFQNMEHGLIAEEGVKGDIGADQFRQFAARRAELTA